MDELLAAELADLAGVTEVEVERLVGLGVLVARDGPGPFLERDVPKVRLAVACERAGLPMEGIVAAIAAGRLSFAFLEGTPFRRWAVRSGPTYRQVSQDSGIPLEELGAVLGRWGSPGQPPTSRCGRTSWRWCRSSGTPCPAGSSTRRGWPGWAGPMWRACG